MKKCPDAESMAAFLDMRCDKGDAEKVARHVLECWKCREACVDVVHMVAAINGQGVELTASERTKVLAGLDESRRLHEVNAFELAWRGIRELVTEAIARSKRYAEGDVEVLAAGNAARSLAFRSWCGESDSDYWKASLEFPTDGGDELSLDLSLSMGSKAAGGQFVLGKLVVEVKEGCAQIPLVDFQAALDTPSLEYRFADGRVSLGRPDLKGLFPD